jgi:hypothetical protein
LRPYARKFNRVTAINHPAFPANKVTYSYGAAALGQPGNVQIQPGRGHMLTPRFDR